MKSITHSGGTTVIFDVKAGGLLEPGMLWIGRVRNRCFFAQISQEDSSYYP